MLVLSRKKDEAVIIDVDGRLIEVLVSEIRGDKARIGFQADKDIQIHREEVYHSLRKRTDKSASPAA